MNQTQKHIYNLIRQEPLLMTDDRKLYVSYCEKVEGIEFNRANFLTNCPMPETIRRDRQKVMETLYNNPNNYNMTDYFWDILRKIKKHKMKLAEKKKEELGYNSSSMRQHYQVNAENKTKMSWDDAKDQIQQTKLNKFKQEKLI